MIPDNQWHIAFITKLNGVYNLFDSIPEMDQEVQRLGIKGRIEYEQVMCNWNHGQPLMECHDGTVALIDSEISGDKGTGTMKVIRKDKTNGS